MKRRIWSQVALAAGFAAALMAAEPPAGKVVELPPMLIEETSSLPPWLYARAGEAEYLARCSERTTRAYAEMRRDRVAWLHALFPADLFARTDVPLVTLLVSQRYKPTSNAEVIGAVLETGRRTEGGGFLRATTAPNMMLHDSDAVGVFAYIDENNFRRDELTIASDFVAFLLERRQPVLPQWLGAGILQNYNAIDFEAPGITLRALAWPSLAASLARTPTPAELLSSPETKRPERLYLPPSATGPRVVLSATELFLESQTWSERPALARAQAALFVRWGIDPRNGVREKFWAFARRACEEPVSERLFESCFGFGFSDLRDQLSDYLPVAVREPLQLPAPKITSAPMEIRPATPAEVARLRGEWERLSVPLVRRRYPDHAERYRAQALRTLHRAYDVGERDPGVVASLALCELDRGDEVVARPLLERAAESGVVRPRVYFELARLRWNALVRQPDAPRELEPAELAPVLQPLRTGLRQAPELPAAAELFADACLRSKAPVSESDLAELVRLSRLFVADPGLCFRLARALGRHGRMEAAAQVLNASFPYVSDEAQRRQFGQLFGLLSKRS